MKNGMLVSKLKKAFDKTQALLKTFTLVIYLEKAVRTLDETTNEIKMLQGRNCNLLIKMIIDSHRVSKKIIA